MTKSDEKSPVKSAGPTTVPDAPSSAGEVDAFLSRVKSLQRTGTGRGRLIFAMDATMSRRPTWDMALALQSEMFRTVKAIGGLDVQLVYFRGYGECGASKWVGDADALARLMTAVECRGGYTQIGKVLTHAAQEGRESKVNALVYVGDCMEEDVDRLSALAGELGLLGLPAFMFQEGREPNAEQAFREIARLSRGAYCRFDTGSAAQLKELLSAVAAYAAGGTAALENMRGDGGARALLEQLG